MDSDQLLQSEKPKPKRSPAGVKQSDNPFSINIEINLVAWALFVIAFAFRLYLDISYSIPTAYSVILLLALLS